MHYLGFRKIATCGASLIKMSHLHRSDALIPQGTANVEKDHW